jgi:HK97 gp10 family phage protein
MPIEYKPNVGASSFTRQVIRDAVVSVFETQIVPEAKRLSPVTPEGLAHNLELHRKRPGGTGTNRRSIDAEFEFTERGPKATMFTSSGYGGYLEVGTARMKAQPYMWPALKTFAKNIVLEVRKQIGRRRG